MPQLPTELLGYDRAITVFSPDGRLLQVEYARQTVSQGATAIGITCKDGIVLVADKRIIEKLIVKETVEKIFQVDDHIGATMSGLISDGRVLVERAQEHAQRHKILYDEPIDITSLVKRICNHKQLYTQYAGTRPFGVSLLIAGVDESGPRLFATEPSGIYFEYKAAAIGEGALVVRKFLEKHYKEEIICDEAIRLALKALKQFLGEKFRKDRIEVAMIPKRTRKFRKLKEIDEYLKRL
jgi:proteasome alpha subunit